MPGIEDSVAARLGRRGEELRKFGFDHFEVEPLFPFISKMGKMSYWQPAMCEKFKQAVEKPSGARFRGKDFRLSFAQMARDTGVPIEIVPRWLDIRAQEPRSCVTHESEATAHSP